MKSLQGLLIIIVGFFVVLIGLPSLLVLPFASPPSSTTQQNEQSPPQEKSAQENVKDTTESIQVAVYRSEKETIDTLPLEQYLVGVVAAEMPADFEMEALKAQALAARTYTVKQLLAEEVIGVPEGADMTDTVMHQVYYDDAQLRNNWGAAYDEKHQKIQQAVNSTQGQILTFDDAPITASFFSTSNGYTENSEDYWANAFPYLRSVESPWDTESPKFKEVNRIPIEEFEAKLNVALPGDGTVGTIVSRTDGKRVAEVNINGKVMSGRDVREQLNLRSTDFEWRRVGQDIELSTKGYGHGVGMSQYGANGMAEVGKTYKDIVTYYYHDIDVTTMAPFVAQMKAEHKLVDSSTAK
ncbi:stage II sporulation protein D [Aureibacillus halotolerans]|uniref:Stage II sporulation protein D n=1 Tax=Aureibacillus halotolerans TaxID=1508390 RepID=A0A4R6U0I6_9BACI|nr:stage II sporulation protein D [Aureibacillus halotolerans]TDQ38722.1 stage II sporulation protein D [Aureibacillus halotolerans]